MNPIEATPEQVAYWVDRNGGDVRQVVIGGPEEAPDVIPCPALVGTVFTLGPDSTMTHQQVVHVAFQLDEIEVAALAQGGTLWLTTWGGLPIHLVEVVPPGAVHNGTTDRDSAPPRDPDRDDRNTPDNGRSAS